MGERIIGPLYVNVKTDVPKAIKPKALRKRFTMYIRF